MSYYIVCKSSTYMDIYALQIVFVPKNPQIFEWIQRMVKPASVIKITKQICLSNMDVRDDGFKKRECTDVSRINFQWQFVI